MVCGELSLCMLDRVEGQHQRCGSCLILWKANNMITVKALQGPSMR